MTGVSSVAFTTMIIHSVNLALTWLTTIVVSDTLIMTKIVVVLQNKTVNHV